MVSDRAREQWAAYVRARGSDTALFDQRDELHQFLIGLHLRNEPLSAADLAALVDEAGMDAGERLALTDRIEEGLALLAAYDRKIDGDEEIYGTESYGGFEI